ncbi:MULTISPECIES: septal ring lytic transglycosylase RlpA family protein [Pseudomonas]|uniref:Endolytic peptidoglycan transglycosylase RlpA n=1 Tax=Pseudomonas quercus TaxID=2722792 RepID=A0ABX0YDJ1_9PSED|nr:MULTISPECIES: septal ring lytic transglycosylase RlpA family protein [Pseudomonas]MBF7142852.1 septal ring lytic transglycosylase RlpA family protein [Pseudomonas sp. LY10J]NJP01400.1 septal ring lytic transglycosylase RlpA family protein [Pseudomonas quercus]
MRRLMFLTAGLLLLAGCASDNTPLERGQGQEGVASYYGARHQGKRTASGERFDQNSLTAAHRSLPFGTEVQVTNLSNDRTVVVRINDRGPHARNRIIDLSRNAAQQLGMTASGTARVRIERLD